ncbi:hypothetical protein E1287_13245 [Actinomadura sp. KC06]|uniref:hypothetical protein n=1 Tax=Actinomadura sp. KC06 TaxID=2530369 RepID=UPI001047CEA9|nr:hypothetical protein [Actinomadura sp. KC06]TDD35610.1 hypothetical protein E1287_13245 [Actinomadura sp. KC06]
MMLYLDDVQPLGGGSPWRTFTIPGSAPPVALVRLEVDRGDGSSTSLVRFPAGWTRPGAGYYGCDEEFVVLDGELEVSGVGYGPGDRGWIPARGTRTDSRTSTGVTALAWFSGVPDWFDGAGGAPGAVRTPLLTVPIPDGGLPLRSGRSEETRGYERVPASFGSAARVLWLAAPHGPRWTALGPGDPVPPGRTGRAFVHLRYSN